MATAAEKQREVASAVASMPAGSDLLVIDGRTGRAVARRPGAGDKPNAAVIVAGPVSLDRLGVRPAVRPGRFDAGASGSAPGELAWFSPVDRRRIKQERNRLVHGARERRAEAAPAPPSAPHGATGSDSRPGASDEAAAPHTRPRVTAI